MEYPYYGYSLTPTVSLPNLARLLLPRHRKSNVVGAYYGMAIVGPAIGFGVGGLFARYLNVDFLRNIVIPEDEQLTPDSPRWVGCWWLGFVIFGFTFYPFGTLVCGLPKVLKGTRELIEMKKLKAREDEVTGNKIMVPEITSFKKLPYLLWYIVKNVRFDLLTIAGCCELLLITGLSTHFPKILEQQFNLGPLMVSVSIALVFVPPCLFGLGIGALIMRTYQLKLKGTLLLCTCLMACATILVCGIAFHCPGRNYTESRLLSEWTKSELLKNDDQAIQDTS